jgi:hypothetical protein
MDDARTRPIWAFLIGPYAVLLLFLLLVPFANVAMYSIHPYSPTKVFLPELTLDKDHHPRHVPGDVDRVQLGFELHDRQPADRACRYAMTLSFGPFTVGRERMAITENTALIRQAMAYVIELYHELTVENGAPTLGTQKSVDFILADPELSQAVSDWARTVEIDEATTKPSSHLSLDGAYQRIRAYPQSVMDQPVFTRPRAGGLGPACVRAQRGGGSFRRSSRRWWRDGRGGRRQRPSLPGPGRSCPIAEWLVGGDQQRSPLVPGADQFKEHAGFGLVFRPCWCRNTSAPARRRSRAAARLR